MPEVRNNAPIHYRNNDYSTGGHHRQQEHYGHNRHHERSIHDRYRRHHGRHHGRGMNPFYDEGGYAEPPRRSIFGKIALGLGLGGLLGGAIALFSRRR